MRAFTESARDSAHLHTGQVTQPGDFSIEMIEFFRGIGRDLQLVN
ncbi:MULTISPECIES: hypothetical protein [Bradyrhizobium]|nr:hypothetical protein [Bradyrhizobium sp. CW4]